MTSEDDEKDFVTKNATRRCHTIHDAEQKIRDGVRRHRVAQPVFAQHQPLIRRAA